jgi:enolase
MIDIDGTPNKGNMGANAILAISLAAAKAGAAAHKIPLYRHFGQLAGRDKFVLPTPFMNVINGGKHAGNKLAMQEFMIVPQEATSFSEAMRMGCEVFAILKNVIKKKYGQDAVNVGDEGGFAPAIQKNDEGLNLLMDAIEKAGYTGKVKLAMDVAASEFYTSTGSYDLNFKDSSKPEIISATELGNLYASYASKYPIVSIEDPFDQDDWAGYGGLTSKIGKNVQIVGDDLLVTNPKRIKEAVSKKACNVSMKM